ncbi:BnaAnng35200D [Brassica napus]|uniref:BnaAnng35200D protein n=2 Tax=Brassica napus TaxID=3708 RepID=A0A078JZ57_BRANA|nr:BnaAnng35200D [Brassica napus]
MRYPQFQEFMRPPLGFPLDGGDPLRQQEGSSGTDIGRPLLPFESLKLPVSSSSTNSGGGGNGNDHKREKEEGEADNSVGFWNGMLSAGDSAASAGGPWQ